MAGILPRDAHRRRAIPPRRTDLLAVVAPGGALGLGPRAGLRLGLLRVAVRTLVAQLRTGRSRAALGLRKVLARVAGDHVADDEEQGEQAAADREQERAVRVGL